MALDLSGLIQSQVDAMNPAKQQEIRVGDSVVFKIVEPNVSKCSAVLSRHKAAVKNQGDLQPYNPEDILDEAVLEFYRIYLGMFTRKS